MTIPIVDFWVVVIANLFNIFLSAMFLLRVFKPGKLASAFGWISVAMAIPLGLAAWFNLSHGRAWNFWVLPLITVLYCVVEFCLDGIFQVDFRRNRWLGAYLLVYYAGLMALIGYAFCVNSTSGFITLITYFINLAATAFSYSRVKHGKETEHVA